MSVKRVALNGDALVRKLRLTCADSELAGADRIAQVAVRLQRGVALR